MEYIATGYAVLMVGMIFAYDIKKRIEEKDHEE
jgi:hypothetical protein